MTTQRDARRIHRSVWRFTLLVALMGCSYANAHKVHHHPAVPAEASSADESVRDLIRVFRQTGDDRLLDRAWTLAEPALESANTTALIDAAVVAQARHDFDGALQLLDRAHEIQPNLDQAWLLKASVHLVRGKTDDAAHACRELNHSPLLVTTTCSARVAIARGDDANALRKLTAVLAAIDETRAEPDPYAWALSAAGDAATSSDAAHAIAFYRRSLSIVDNAQVRAALIDVLLAGNQIQAAAAALPKQRSHSLALNVRRMIVGQRLEQARHRQGASHSPIDHAGEHDRDIEAADHRFRHWIADGDWTHAREMARFYLDVLERPALAQTIAQTNLSLQREREDLLLAQRTGVLATCNTC
ncbi:MAG: hypothetical protein AAF417_02415 [Pseudomonadota bacterium]